MPRYRTLLRAASTGMILALAFLAKPAGAQQTLSAPGGVAAGNISGGTFNIGLTPAQVQKLTKAAAAGAVGPLTDKIVDLSTRLGVTQGAALSMLRILGERDVPLEQLPQRLAEVATQFQKLQAQLAALDPRNPLARGLVDQAQAEIKAGNFTKAHELLGQAKQAQIAAAQQARELRQKAQAAEDEQLIQAAASSAAEGGLSLTELHYLQAADLFKEAASTVPQGHEGERWEYLNAEAAALYRQGDEFGDNDAARSAIERYRHLVELRPRNAYPSDWAMTQNILGNALGVLGAREGGTARLEEAVAVYREALQENTRARVPLDWAGTQMNLGLALWRLGERESGTARLEEAIAAYHDALQEYTRARVPLQWAGTRTGLGAALVRLGERESGTTRLEEAVAAFREALQERTRARAARLGHDPE
jgi:tetratricopeptide (TPR) repeat protein